MLKITDGSPRLLLRRYVADLASRGVRCFTTDEATRALAVSAVAARAAIRRLKKAGEIATPMRGFHLGLPPEYRRLGCFPPEQLVPLLMGHLQIPYYAALLSAANFHGATPQLPQVFQVVVRRYRPPILCGRVRVHFVGKARVERTPVAEWNTPRGPIRVSTPEATAMDLMCYPGRAGGISSVLEILGILAESIDPDRLAGAAPCVEIPAVQRLGWHLDRLGFRRRTGPLALWVARTARRIVPLDPTVPLRGARRNRRWGVAVNAVLERES